MAGYQHDAVQDGILNSIEDNKLCLPNPCVRFTDGTSGRFFNSSEEHIELNVIDKKIEKKYEPIEDFIYQPDIQIITKDKIVIFEFWRTVAKTAGQIKEVSRTGEYLSLIHI